MTQQHPAAWWLSALAIAATTAAINHGAFSVAAVFVALAVGLRHAYSTQARRNFIVVAIGLAGLVAVRVILQNLLGYPMGSHVLVTLPTIDMPMWLSGLRLGGSITSESVLFALSDGARIAAIALAFVSAATVTSPTRVLRALPLSMQSAGMIVVIAVTFLPHLLADLSRVRNASRWRGQQLRGLRHVMAQMINVAESALDRSVTLAAALTVRGYAHSPSRNRWSLLIGSTGAIGFGFALALSGFRLNLGMGFLLSLIAMRFGVQRPTGEIARTRYRQSEWTLRDVVIAVSPVAAALTYIVANVATSNLSIGLICSLSVLLAAVGADFIAVGSRKSFA